MQNFAHSLRLSRMISEEQHHRTSKAIKNQYYSWDSPCRLRPFTVRKRLSWYLKCIFKELI